MKNARLGCLTPFGLLAALITLLAIAVSVTAQGGGLFSPGPLNAQRGALLGGIHAHAEIGGDCAACHTAPWDNIRMTDRCLVCHTQIQTELDDPDTLHGTLIQRSGDSCLGCHTEHHGPLGELTRVDIDDFPHDQTGFSLASHLRRADGDLFSCQDCHHSRPDGRRFEPVANRDCDDCHMQLNQAYMEAHHQAFSVDCMACHDGVDRFSGFDHNQLSFPLENAHARLECQACHQGQNTPAALSQTPAECSACHAEDDHHNGAYGSQCVLCHTTRGWDDIIFDHSASRFPLTGLHEELPCASCHDQAYRGTPLDCAACHTQDDHHDGAFGIECQLCHSPQGWSEIIFDHAVSRFPLTGAHDGLPCSSCHQETFRGTPLDCAACHQEPVYHAGLFQPACADCHTTAAWQPAQYSQAHGFPQSHGDANSCRDCHTVSLAAYTCYTCHEQREIIEEHQDEGITDLANCAGCHEDGTEDGGREDDRDRDDDD